jgi:hypothetical protein
MWLDLIEDRELTRAWPSSTQLIELELFAQPYAQGVSWYVECLPHCPGVAT